MGGPGGSAAQGPYVQQCKQLSMSAIQGFRYVFPSQPHTVMMGRFGSSTPHEFSPG